MAAAAAAEVQALLRFLTQDAKIPLAEAMSKIGALRKRQLSTPESIATADLQSFKDIFTDDKIAKQVVNAAKRNVNPRKRSASQTAMSQPKRSKHDLSQHDVEARLALPEADASVAELQEITIESNRAPLFLAFATVALEFAMPDQPLSSRLSLAQSVVSANSQSKAKSIGLLSGATAEEDGWAQGQPKLRILGREVAVMRRQTEELGQEDNSQATVIAESASTHEAFWGLDVEALRRSNGPLVAGKLAGSSGPPIHSPEAARSYLLKSITIQETESKEAAPAKSPSKKKSGAEVIAMKERATAMLLKSIRLLCESWTDTLSSDDLNKRAYSWYLSVRPEVAQGQSGWGQRGQVKLSDILKLRRNV